MKFNRMWTSFALDAEYETFGVSRIVDAGNALQARVAELEEKLNDACAIAKEFDGVKDAYCVAAGWLHCMLMNVYRMRPAKY